MRRLSLLILVLMLSVGLLAACGSKDEEPFDEGSVEEVDELESLAADDVSFDDLDDDDELYEDTDLEIPEGFPSDYPILDNYVVTEAAYFEPDSVTGELVKLELRYDDPDMFTEAIELYENHYNSDGYEIEFAIEHGELDTGFGTFDLKATTEEKAHFCVISRSSHNDYFTIEFSIRNKVDTPDEK